MPYLRSGAVIASICAALLLCLLTAAVPVSCFASGNEHPSALLLSLNADADDGLFDGPASASGKTPLLSILYDACTFGELYPCPT